MKTTIVLLPGLNGTTGLFEPLLQVADDQYDLLPISYPTHDKLGYEDLTAFVHDKVNELEGDYVLVGESFSGPLSLFVAAKKPAGLLGVVLVASFVTAPNLQVGKFLPWTFGFSLAKPLYKFRQRLSNKHNRSFIESISTELQKVSPQVLAFRVQQIFAVDATQALKNCFCPVIYFRGTSDHVVPARNLRKVLSLKPDVGVVEFDAQHFLLQSCPEQAFAAIRCFTDKINKP